MNRRYPIESSEYFHYQFSKTITDEEVSVLLNGSISRSQNGEAWIPVIINCSANSSENELVYDEGDTSAKIVIKLISYQ